jgi:catechol 2,3-dioxygenase-like lactoylglutathione lyase family enzyme
MIDHVSIAVRDLARATRFYETALGVLGFTKLAMRPTTVGFGKRYPEFWLNLRPDMVPIGPDSGAHVCLRSPTTTAIDTFFAAALAAGGSADGQPGLRPEYGDGYYAAFVGDPDGNRIEVVTFLKSPS